MSDGRSARCLWQMRAQLEVLLVSPDGLALNVGDLDALQMQRRFIMSTAK
jgi:hypothetical protein